MKIVITAPGGKMGKLVVREALKRPADFTIVGAVGNPVRDYIGKDISAATHGEEVGARIYGDIEEIIAECDGVVDFSTVEASMQVVAACVKHRKPLLLGTTGFSEEQERIIAEAGKHIAIAESHNTSKAVNLIYELLRSITAAVGQESDVDIVEMHDRKKLDAPSGTSKVMGRIIAEELGVDWNEKAVFGREGKGQRGEHEITYHSIRSGNISSSHTVIFGMDGERIELTHHSYDFGTFAKGALDCVLFLRDKAPGMYSSQEALGLV
ncbi:MAG: 4-hydroxy-tetrahydrodipicolinate reductase [Oscillospiraceae bacterium]